MKSKDFRKTSPVKSASLGRVLNQSKKIKETVKQAAGELTTVNKILKQGKKANDPVQSIKAAIAQNEDVELKVAKAADDLHQVNTELAREVADRVAIESELADTIVELADALDDLSKSQVKEEETRQITLQDALTGLPNRALFEQRLEHGLIQARRHGWKLAVLFIDIDKFKNINDSYGHDLGDKALLVVADRLLHSIREEDIVSRWGGDEFACLLLDIKQEDDAIRLAEKMADHIAETCDFNGIVLSIKPSIGIAMYPADGETADALFKNADTAMYKAKGTENRVALFDESAFNRPRLSELPLRKAFSQIGADADREKNNET
jgi:diguanylate cyclase (GGDEF)-like protein